VTALPTCGSCRHRGDGTSHGAGSLTTEVVHGSHVWCRFPHRSGSVVGHGVRAARSPKRPDVPPAGFVLTEATANPTVGAAPWAGEPPHDAAPFDRPRPPANRVLWPLRRWRLVAPANRCSQGDAIWPTGPAFLRGVAREPVCPKASRTSSERTRSRRSSVIRLTCAPASWPSESPRLDPPTGARERFLVARSVVPQ